MIDLTPLERCFDDALDAMLSNPVALIFTDLALGYQGKRDLVFALGLLREGENECALIAGFIRERLRAEPDADVAHMEREAWYYVRTSIDPNWQFDDGEPSIVAGIAYITQALRERTAAVRARPKAPDEPPPLDDGVALLKRLRAQPGTSQRVS